MTTKSKLTRRLRRSSKEVINAATVLQITGRSLDQTLDHLNNMMKDQEVRHKALMESTERVLIRQLSEIQHHLDLINERLESTGKPMSFETAVPSVKWGDKVDRTPSIT